MLKFINDIIMEFKPCFSRQRAFNWFVVIIIGLMIRTEHLGVTSIIRALGIKPSLYTSMLHFFRAHSWRLNSIEWVWLQIIKKSGLIYEAFRRPLIIGDGVNESKEGRKMPCVKKLKNGSENSKEPSFIYGHMFGAIGIILGTPKKFFCTLLSAHIHDGDETIRGWSGDDSAKESHVVRMIREACKAASHIKPSILILDRYFLTVPALLTLMEAEREAGRKLVDIVTRAKKNIVAYEKPNGKPKPSRGRPRKKGQAVKLQSLFETEIAYFRKIRANMYGKLSDVEVLVKDLLWGKGLYRELRFVLVKYNGIESILVSTDTTLSAEEIIEIYAFRAKIESSFREFKQVIAGFASRFWTRSMLKLNRFAKNDKTKEELLAITENAKKAAIQSALKAIEAFTLLALIAFGLIQLLSLRFANAIDQSALRWLRTKRSNIPSEATTVDFLRKTIFRQFENSPDLPIVRLIKRVQADLPEKSREVSD